MRWAFGRVIGNFFGHIDAPVLTAINSSFFTVSSTFRRLFGIPGEGVHRTIL